MKKESNMHLIILEEAKRLTGEKGYNGWSYQDISDAVKITKASIHHHFPKKQDLGCALVRHHRHFINDYLALVDSELTHLHDKLEAVIEVYSEILKQGSRSCPCGMLLADLMTLPDALQQEIKDFFSDHQSWIYTALSSDVKDKNSSMDEILEREAFLIVSFLQGALLMARLKDSPCDYFKHAAKQFLTQKFR